MAAHPEPDLFEHVRDAHHFHLPFGIEIPLPKIPLPDVPLITKYFGHRFEISKYMVLQLVAGVFLFLVFRGLARRVASGTPPKGPWWNFWETLALYIRDNVVRPTIGVPHAAHGHSEHGHDEHAHDAHGHGEAHAGAAVAGHPADRFFPISGRASSTC